MSSVQFSYVDSALAHMDAGGSPPPFWRHFHWGLFDDPDPAVADDGPERYFAAAEAMTSFVVAAAGVGDGRRVLDVGCGFGGTLDLVGSRWSGCGLVGLNIDLRQLQAGRRLLGAGSPICFVAGDGCRLPVASGSVDHVLAVECVFHFPSRKAFFEEVARVLRPGGTLALSDFLMAPGALATVADAMAGSGLGDNEWYGHMAKPLTSVGYERLARRTGLELLVDDDVNRRTLPTYPALRRLAAESSSSAGLTTIDGLESLARADDLAYHVLSFRRP
jgi:SAM-dependent methyltransferase